MSRALHKQMLMSDSSMKRFTNYSIRMKKPRVPQRRYTSVFTLRENYHKLSCCSAEVLWSSGGAIVRIEFTAASSKSQQSAAG